MLRVALTILDSQGGLIGKQVEDVPEGYFAEPGAFITAKTSPEAELDGAPSVVVTFSVIEKVTKVCPVCKDKGGPGPLDQCPECGKYGPLAND